jgi:hypothetical protein
MRGADAVAHNKKTGAQLWAHGKRVSYLVDVDLDEVYVRTPLVTRGARSAQRRAQP